MKRFLLVLNCVLSFCLFSQDHLSLNPEERAYLFHIVKKSPILDQNIGRYFQYVGPEVKFVNGEINYDSVEVLIINDPSLLVIHRGEIAKSTKGIIAEASNKMAIWHLNKTLMAKRSGEDFGKYEEDYLRFESYLLEKLPSIVIDTKGEQPHVIERFQNVLNPVMTFDDKIAQLRSFRGMTVENEMLCMKAMAYAVNRFVEENTLKSFLALGGEASQFKNVLTAAGDGSTTSGLLEEREKDERGRWNKGLPKAVGLFPYEPRLIESKNPKDDPEVSPSLFTVSDFETVGENKHTTLHFDVWGYNTEKQTTVVIEKDGLSYHLFGSGETRFLSPDSAFSSGSTFQAIINNLELVKIADLTEKISGKRGFDYWIDYYKKKKDETELKIIKREKEYSDLGYSPISTSTKPSRQVKKAKKRAVKAESGAGSWTGTPTTDSGQKSRKKLQNEIVYLYERYGWYKAKIEELEIEKKEAIDLRAQYQRRLDLYYTMMGRNWATFKEEDGLYIFQDSSTFDIYTQEFQFPASERKDGFDVRLIAIPQHSLSDQADEVMLHVSMVDAKPNYNARLQVELNDLFESDSWELTRPLITEKDSISVRQFFEVLLDNKESLEIIARGDGIGKWNGSQTVKDYKPTTLNGYGRKLKSDSSFSRLRKSDIKIHMDRCLCMEVNSFTDPVKSNIKIDKQKLKDLQLQHNLSNNDILSAYRTVAILKKFKEELNIKAGEYLTREEAKLVIDKFNRQLSKTKVIVGSTSISLNEF